MTIKTVFNFSTGAFEFLESAEPPTSVESAAKVQVEFDLYGSGSVGDLIVPSTVQPDAVQAITTNYNYPSAAFGIITEFVSASRVKVLVSGLLAGPAYQLSGLTFGKALFVSSTGKLTTSAPATGPLQKMGIALNSTTIFLLPSLDIINRS